MKFVNMTNNLDLSQSIAKAEVLLTPGSKMWHEIWFKNDWKYDSGNGPDIARRLNDGDANVKIFTYRPWNRFTRAIAMTNGDGAIHFNVYKVNKTSLESKVGTILHEYAHLCGFKHGSNFKTKEKCLYSVPYFLSENVKRWL